MKCRNLKFGISNLNKRGYDELLALAASLHDYQGLDPGDLVWAKLTGTHPIVFCTSDFWCFQLNIINFMVIFFL